MEPLKKCAYKKNGENARSIFLFQTLNSRAFFDQYSIAELFFSQKNV